MNPNDKLKFLFAINPASGGIDKSSLEADIRNHFNDTPHHVRLSQLDGQTDDVELQRELDHWRPDRVVAVGGDGTVKLVAEKLMGTAMTLGILPMGSANGLARELNLPTNLQQALDVLLYGIRMPLDAIRINQTEICLHLSDIGLNAQLVKYYAENNWRGKLGYLRGVFRTLSRKRALRVEVTAKDQTLRRAAYMVVLANARMYGTGAVINPDGDLSDGAFEVVILRTLRFWEILKMFWRYQPLNTKQIEIISATSIAIETRKKAYFQIDGEYRGKVRRIEAEILPGQIQVLVRKLSED